MFNKNRGPKPDKESIALIRRIGGKSFSAVNEIEPDGTERFLGRGGGVSIAGYDVVVISDGKETFRCTLDTLRAGELLSGNGVRLSGIGPDGERHSVIAMYNKL